MNGTSVLLHVALNQFRCTKIIKFTPTLKFRSFFSYFLVKMSAQFFSKLSQNYIELLEDDEYQDVTIEVGEDPNVKFFRAHMNILCYRSPYLRRVLASSKKNNDGVLARIKLPNVSPEIFPTILK